MSQFTDRMIRAAKLDVNLYEEVEADTTSIGQAMGVVVLSSVAAGIGSIGHGGATGLIGGLVASLVGWFAWAFVTFYIGTKLLPEPQTRSDVGELLRTIGFSGSPGILRVIGIIPGLYILTNFIVGIWMLVAMVIAVRQALDYRGTGRAILVCIAGWIVFIILSMIMSALIP